MSKHRKISGQFVPRRPDMLRSPAFWALSLWGHRILARIEIEHASHGGQGQRQAAGNVSRFRRVCSDRQPARYCTRHPRGLALGFIEVTRRGRAGNGEYRTPNLFRLTYLPTSRRAATDEWRAIETVEQAEQDRPRGPQNPSGKKFILPVGENDTGTSGGKHTNTSGGNRTRTPLNHRWRKPTPLSRYLSI